MAKAHHPTPIGRRLRKVRTDLGLSQAELARRAGVDPSSVSKVEAGQTERPSGEYLAQLAAALNVPVSTLIDADSLATDARTMSFSADLEIFQHQLAALPPELAASLLEMWRSSLVMAEQARKLREN